MPFPQTEKEGGEIVINICTICKGEIQEPPYLMAYGPQDREAYFHEHCWDANPGIVSGYTLALFRWRALPDKAIKGGYMGVPE